MKRLWRWLRSPNARWSTGALLIAGGVAGIVFWTGFNTVMEYSDSIEFCTGCHGLTWAAEEYRQSRHYQNPSGVRAACHDCHVPKPWFRKVARKVRATLVEVPATVFGTINTKEKFEAKRLELAERVWDEMKRNGSLECRNCHTPSAMLLTDQKPRSRSEHEDAARTGQTCIDCHKGIAHTKPKTEEEEKQEDSFQL